MKSLFFIPVYNQAAELPGLIRELRAELLPCDTLLFVNNGSDDGSELMIRESGFPWIDLERNRGIGAAFMAAADRALAGGYDLFGVLAGNGKMLPGEMGRVMGPVLRGEADYVTGSRYLPGGSAPNLPGFRSWAIPAVTQVVNLLLGVRITDATCGYRCYRVELLRRARFDWHAAWLAGYGFEYYLYGKVLLDPSIRAIEVPVTMRYPPAGSRYTKIRAITGWFDMLRPFLVARFDGQGFAAPLREAACHET